MCRRSGTKPVLILRPEGGTFELCTRSARRSARPEGRAAPTASLARRWELCDLGGVSAIRGGLREMSRRGGPHGRGTRAGLAGCVAWLALVSVEPADAATPPPLRAKH